MKKESNKILIFSVNGDLSTDNVTNWLEAKGYTTIRYNSDIDYNTSSLTFELGKANSTITLSIENTEIDLNAIKSVWVRKFHIPNFSKTIPLGEEYKNRSEDIYKYLSKEYSSGLFSIIEFLKSKRKVLGNKITKQPSKYEMLLIAKSLDIDIPNSLITNKKADLLRFLKQNKEVVTKPIKDVEMFVKHQTNTKNICASTYTELLNSAAIEKIPDTFFVSQFQEKLNKAYEIRSFYLDGTFYSSAIFSQLDNQTDVDFRMYNNKKPNRVVPYKLPNKIENKLTQLMKILGLKTGSLDLIKTTEGRLVFLEVNPWGQFGMVSIPCNYHLDEKVANYLIH